MSIHDQAAFANLIEKYLEGSASPEEVETLEAYYSLFSDGPEALDGLLEGDLLGLELKLKSGVLDKIESVEKAALGNEVRSLSDGVEVQEMPIIPLYRKWGRVIAAAVVLVIFTLGVWFYIGQKDPENNLIAQAAENKIMHGGNRAVLTLADGQTIVLSDDQSGIVVGGDSILYSDGSTIESSKAITMLTLSTPKGGQYQITLSDGTKVWLNAASSIKYPSRFTGTERRVELEGEAYFEVAEQVSDVSNPHSGISSKLTTKTPFIVITINQEVKVLGTHFNIKAYRDEASTETSLLEGSVQVSTISLTNNTPNLSSVSSTILSPGQQSILSGKNIETKTIDPGTATAWKNGYFQFNDEELGSIMLKISRWYDVGVNFEEASLKKELFAGLVNRFTNVGELLQTLELTKRVSFEITGKSIIVKKPK